MVARLRGHAMGFEIERKFLVRAEHWRGSVTTHARIRQAYLSFGKRSSTRVRIKDDGDATLTIKSRGAEIRRLELEYRIPVLEAEALMALRHSGLIEKTRHIVPWRGHTWEVDVFAGENSGLVVAEIELRDEHEPFERPPWLGVEITGQSQYYNGALAERPFCRWGSSFRGGHGRQWAIVGSPLRVEGTMRAELLPDSAGPAAGVVPWGTLQRP
jgi:adenylate cyclase